MRLFPLASLAWTVMVVATPTVPFGTVAVEFSQRHPIVAMTLDPTPPKLPSIGFLAGHIKTRSDGKALWVPPTGTAQRQQGGADVQQKAYESRNRIARQPKHQRITDLAKTHGPTRFDGQLPHMALSQGLQGGNQVIFLSSGSPTRGKDHIVI